jgi:hypothetical protein
MKQSKANKVMKYVAKHPNAKPIETAKATGVDVSYVYIVMSKAKAKAKAESDLAFQISQGRSKLRMGRPPMRMQTIAMGISDRSVMGRLVNTHAKDDVNHPEHYTFGGIETIDYMEAKSTKEEFTGHLRLTALKYLSRANNKGDAVKDLKKAQWYLNKLVSTLEK